MKRYTLDAKCFAFVLTALICTATMTPPAALADGPQIQQNSATQNIVLGPIIATSNAAAGADHISNLTGAVLTVTIAKNGGSFISPSGAVTEIGKGRYTLAANATDDNTLGTLSVDVVASLANPTAAPSVSTATTGGSIAAGTYYLGYTYTTAAGQTVLSPTAAVTTTGTTSTITLTTPALPSGCTGITAYEGAAANATILALASTTNTATLTTLPSGSLPAPVTNTAVAGDPWSKDFPIVAVNPLDASLFGLTGVGTLAGQTTISGQTAKIGTNAADSPAQVIAQGQVAGINTAVTTSGVKVGPTQSYNNTGQTTAPTWISVDGSGRVLLQPAEAYLNSTPGTVAPTWYTAPPTPAQIAAVTSSYAADGPAATAAGTILALTITHNGSGQPVLTWTADSAATSYKVLRSTDGVNYTTIATPAAGTLTYTDTARPVGGTVYYHITSSH